MRSPQVMDQIFRHVERKLVQHHIRRIIGEFQKKVRAKKQEPTSTASRVKALELGFGELCRSRIEYEERCAQNKDYFQNLIPYSTLNRLSFTITLNQLSTVDSMILMSIA